MFCSNLTRCFGRNAPSDQQEASVGVAPPEVAGNSIQRSQPYQDLSYEVAPGVSAAAGGSWTEIALPAGAQEPVEAASHGRRDSVLERIRKLCTRERSPEEVEIEMLRKEKKEILQALKNFGIDDKRMKLVNIKNMRAEIDKLMQKELEKLAEEQAIEMQDMNVVSEPVPIPTLETNVDDVLPPLKGPSVDYPLTQPDPVGDGQAARGEKSLSWKLATPIQLPDFE